MRNQATKREQTAQRKQGLVKAKGKVVTVFNKLSTMPWRRMGEWMYSSTIFDLDSKSR
jgi:hypothetical protein